jgi:FlaA1/EpsC-like NDP-sugar epimerase
LSLKSLIITLAASSYYTKRGILIIADTVMLTFALWASAALRLEQLWPPMLDKFSWLFIALPLVSVPVFVRLGMYRAVIRYTSLDALWVIFVATFYSTLLMAALLLITDISGFPRSVPLIYFILSFVLLGGSRLTFRNIYAQYYSAKHAGKRVLIYGAGSSGRQMVTAFQDSSEFKPVCFVDNAKELQGRDLSGLPIYAPEHIERLVEKYRVDMILLAMPSETRKRKKEILRFLAPLPVEVKSLPSLDALVANDISIKDIQDIQIEDLLGRDPVPPQMELIHSCIKGKSVMVTGAGGSIGSELCRQIAANRPRRLVLFERSELALYSIENELKSRFGAFVEIIAVLGSVSLKRRVLAVIKAMSVQTIYHAAAYKHVPLVEYNPIEGIRNNVFGTLRTAEAAIEGNVETFVLISTDKAVRPTNVMGASKRMAELVLQALSTRSGKTRFTMVRFGNVLGSSGSVVPHFREQINKGGPVTVTHPDIIRYFMTIPEAVQLVIQAGAMGKGGDVFVLNMGEPVRIVDLARNMIHLCGLTVRDAENPDGDIAIEYIGLRPGEKLFEELLLGEKVVGTGHPMIMRAEEDRIPWGKLSFILEELDQASSDYDHQKVRRTLIETVDGYTPQCEIIDALWIKMEQKIAQESRQSTLKLELKKG